GGRAETDPTARLAGVLERRICFGISAATDPARVSASGGGATGSEDLEKATTAETEKRTEPSGGENTQAAAVIGYRDEVQLGFCDGVFWMASVSQPSGGGWSRGNNTDAVPTRRPCARTRPTPRGPST